VPLSLSKTNAIAIRAVADSLHSAELAQTLLIKLSTVHMLSALYMHACYICMLTVCAYAAALCVLLLTIHSKKGVLDQAALTSLSKLIFFVFQPCLLFVNVASTLAMKGQVLYPLLYFFNISIYSLIAKRILLTQYCCTLCRYYVIVVSYASYTLHSK
jgi:hypothetical protein